MKKIYLSIKEIASCLAIVVTKGVVLSTQFAIQDIKERNNKLMKWVNSGL